MFYTGPDWESLFFFFPLYVLHIILSMVEVTQWNGISLWLAAYNGGNGGKIADSVSLGRDPNDDPFRYLIINLIIIDNNDNNSSSRTIKGDSCKLGEGFLSHMSLQIEEMSVSRKCFSLRQSSWHIYA